MRDGKTRAVESKSGRIRDREGERGVTGRKKLRESEAENGGKGGKASGGTGR